jgi:NADH-quinone oxidoreductase subunit N
MIDPQSLMQQLLAVSHANVLLLGGVFFIVIGLMRSASSHRKEQMLCGVGCLIVLAIAAICLSMSQPATASADALFVSDSVTASGAKLALFGGLLLVLLGWEKIKPGHAANHYGCLLMMLSGLIYASSANDLVSLFLGLELVSIPTTVLLSINRSDDLGRESTLKYFALASFASAIFLFGASYLYGVAGTTSLPAVHASLSGNPTLFARAAIGLAICGLCFRVTAVPFHFYAPDVFVGSAPHMAASMSLVPKVAGFVAIVRLLGGSQLVSGLSELVIPLLLLISIITMTVGNCAALVQKKLRRMLAYSSVAHSGYLLLAIAAIVSTGGSPTIVFDYLIVYAAMTLGLFAVVLAIESAASGSDDVSNLDGLYYRNPWLSIGGTICLISLVGLPLTAGFWAKLQVFLTSLAADRIDLRLATIAMAINATIAAIYYLSIAYRMYQPNATKSAAISVPMTTGVACVISSLLTVVWFFIP